MDWRNRLGMITNKVKSQFHARGIDDLESVRKLIFEFDFDGNGVLDKVEFSKFLSKAGIYLTTQELTCVYTTYDKNKDGSIDYNEFIQMIRTEMSEKRLGVVKYAFSFLDAHGAMKIKLEDLQALYHPGDHPRVRTREKTSQQAMAEFSKAIAKKSSDGVHITEAEFLDYYADVNATLPNEKEEYFVDLVLKTWGITTSDSYVSPERIADLEIILYEKIRQKTFTSEDEGKTIKKAFKYFDLDDKGVIDLDQFHKALDKFGCVFNKHESLALFKKYDLDNSGKLCYDEFCNLFASIGAGTNPNVNPVFEIARQPPKDVIDQTRKDCIKRGLYGIRQLGAILRKLDKSNKGGISRNEFLWAVKEAGTTLNKHDLDKIYKYFDKNVEDFVRYPEFVQLVRGPLPSGREDLINHAWANLDTKGTRSVTFETLKQCYEPFARTDVRVGKTKADHAVKEYLSQWNVRKDGTITHEDFVDFCWDVSAAIESDEAFEYLISNSWKAPTNVDKKEEPKVIPQANSSKVRFADQK